MYVPCSAGAQSEEREQVKLRGGGCWQVCVRRRVTSRRDQASFLGASVHQDPSWEAGNVSNQDGSFASGKCTDE